MIEINRIDRRKEARHCERLPLRVQGTDDEGRFFVEIVLTENISVSGACITLNRKVAVGARLHVFISNGMIQNQVIANICWINHQNESCRIGLKFERSLKAWSLLGKI